MGMRRNWKFSIQLPTEARFACLPGKAMRGNMVSRLTLQLGLALVANDCHMHIRENWLYGKLSSCVPHGVIDELF